ncbi:hypothetical protein [Microbacterium sp.]|uniref:hypothetical protein n=1 Tax=Microbacterium sp. TaxID=51671 RepID=UPI003C73BB0E
MPRPQSRPTMIAASSDVTRAQTAMRRAAEPQPPVAPEPRRAFRPLRVVSSVQRTNATADAPAPPPSVPTRETGVQRADSPRVTVNDQPITDPAAARRLLRF